MGGGRLRHFVRDQAELSAWLLRAKLTPCLHRERDEVRARLDEAHARERETAAELAAVRGEHRSSAAAHAELRATLDKLQAREVELSAALARAQGEIERAEHARAQAVERARMRWQIELIENEEPRRADSKPA